MSVSSHSQTETDRESDTESYESYNSYHSSDYPEDSIGFDLRLLRRQLGLPSGFPIGFSQVDCSLETGHHSFSICYKECDDSFQGFFRMELNIPMFSTTFLRKDDEYIQIEVEAGAYWGEKPTEELCEKVKEWIYNAAAEYRTKKRTRVFKEELFASTTQRLYMSEDRH